MLNSMMKNKTFNPSPAAQRQNIYFHKDDNLLLFNYITRVSTTNVSIIIDHSNSIVDRQD